MMAPGSSASASLDAAGRSSAAPAGVSRPRGWSRRSALGGRDAGGGAVGSVALTAGDGTAAGVAGPTAGASGPTTDAVPGSVGGALGRGSALTGACSAGCASGRGAGKRCANKTHATSMTTDAARAAPAAIAAGRFHRVAGPFASAQRRLRTSCMSGRSSGCL